MSDKLKVTHGMRDDGVEIIEIEHPDHKPGDPVHVLDLAKAERILEEGQRGMWTVEQVRHKLIHECGVGEAVVDLGLREFCLI